MSYKWKLKINKITKTEDNDIAMDETSKLFLALREMRAVASRLPAQGAMEVVRARVTELRSEIQTIAFDAYEVVLSLGKQHVFKEIYYEYPTHEMIIEFASQCKGKLKKPRQYSNILVKQRRNFCGLQYEMMGTNKYGHVFTENNSILNIKKNYNPMVRMQQHKQPHAKVKGHYVGIELEFLSVLGIAELNQLFVDAGLEGYVHVGTDGSVHPSRDLQDQGYIGLEIRVLCKQNDVASIIPRVTKILNEKAKAKVNDTCGMHVHFDMRNRVVDVAYHNLTSNVDFLCTLVPYTRTGTDHGMRYCRRNTTKSYNQAMQQENAKYQVINPLTYDRLKTIEVRLHSGTTNATKIVNWIKIIATMLESTEKLTSDVHNCDTFFKTYDIDSALKEYIIKRSELFASSKVTTLQDDSNSNYEMVV